jgi:hypothetical protein
MTRKRVQNARRHRSREKTAAALFTLGSLRGREKSAFEQHVRKGCGVCEQELRGLSIVMENLALAAPPAQASRRVRQRLLDSMAGHMRGVPAGG